MTSAMAATNYIGISTDLWWWWKSQRSSWYVKINECFSAGRFSQVEQKDADDQNKNQEEVYRLQLAGSLLRELASAYLQLFPQVAAEEIAELDVEMALLSSRVWKNQSSINIDEICANSSDNNMTVNSEVNGSVSIAEASDEMVSFALYFGIFCCAFVYQIKSYFLHITSSQLYYLSW